jgi:hypothetical protein
MAHNGELLPEPRAPHKDDAVSATQRRDPPRQPSSSCSSRSPGFRRCGPSPAASSPAGCRSSRPTDGAAGHPAGRTAGLRDEPGHQRLARPPCRCDQRTPSADPLGPDAGTLGLYIAIIWTHALPGGGRRTRAMGADRHRRGAVARLGLQRAAPAPQAQRLVGQCGLRPVLRGHRLGHRCGGDARRPVAAGAGPVACAALQHRGPTGS